MKKILIGVIFIIGVLISNIESEELPKEEIKGVFLSYIEINKYIKNDNYEISKNNINKIISNIKSIYPSLDIHVFTSA